MRRVDPSFDEWCAFDQQQLVSHRSGTLSACSSGWRQSTKLCCFGLGLNLFSAFFVQCALFSTCGGASWSSADPFSLPPFVVLRWSINTRGLRWQKLPKWPPTSHVLECDDATELQQSVCKGSREVHLFHRSNDNTGFYLHCYLFLTSPAFIVRESHAVTACPLSACCTLPLATLTAIPSIPTLCISLLPVCAL